MLTNRSLSSKSFSLLIMLKMLVFPALKTFPSILNCGLLTLRHWYSDAHVSCQVNLFVFPSFSLLFDEIYTQFK